MNTLTRLARLQELLDWEKEEDLLQYQNNVLKRSLKERVEKGYSWYPLIVKRISIGTGEKIILHLEREKGRKSQAIQSGDAVSVFGILSDQEVGKVSGVAAGVNRDSIRVVLGLEFIPDWINKAQIGINLEFDDRTYVEMKTALEKVADAKKDTRLAELRETLIGDKKPTFHRWDYTYTNSILNASQVNAVQRLLEAYDAAIIHGPPGTGKTTTLVQSIKEVLRRENQVLVCAPSNTAVDLLTLRCFQEGMYVVRLGNPARIDEELHKHTLDGVVAEHPDYQSLKQLRKDADSVHKQALKYKRNFGHEERSKRNRLLKESRELKAMAHKLEDYIVNNILNRCQVITATLTGAGNPVLGSKRFHTVFIDEAGQALAPACWIPILRANRVVLAGDHHQLPPTVKSMKADKGGLSKTLFEDLIETHPESATLLTTQYRMNEEIMTFSGNQFYEGRLEADLSVRYRKLGQSFSALSYVDTAGCGFEESRNPETLSRYNTDEAQLLLRHLAHLLNELEAKEPERINDSFSVGIISPYKEQVRRIQNQLKESPMMSVYLPYITVNTVDGFQGQERDVIYISLVRSNKKGEIGFLKDVRRMNVALTRARMKLVVVGDSATIGEHPFYKSFLDYVENLGAYESAWEYADM